MARMLRVPRSRGALSGTLLVLLGAWGALIAFIGPYFHYAFTPDPAWTYTSGRLWLEILPGGVALLGGLIVLAAATRPAAVFGAWIAALSGAWFVIGRTVSTLWTANGNPAVGHAVGGVLTRAVTDIGFFTGLGAVIIFFAAMALGRFTVVGVREAAHAADKAAAADKATAAEKAATADEPVPAASRPGTAADGTSATPATSRRSLTARLPRLPRRQSSATPADRPAGMTATQTREPVGKSGDTPS